MSEEKRLEELLEGHLAEQRELGNYNVDVEPEGEREEDTDEATEAELKEQVEELQETVRQMRERFEEGSRKKSEGKKHQGDGIVELVKRHMVGVIVAAFAMAILVAYYAPCGIPDAENYFEKGYVENDDFYDSYTTAEAQAQVMTKFQFRRYLAACNRAVSRPLPFNVRFITHDLFTDDDDHSYVSMSYDMYGGRYVVSVDTHISGALKSSLDDEKVYPQVITSTLSVWDKENRLSFDTEPEEIDNLADVVWDESWLESRPFFCGRKTFEALISVMQSGSLKAKALNPMAGVRQAYTVRVAYNWDDDDASHDRAWYESLPFPVYDGDRLVNEGELDRPEDDPEEVFYRGESW